MTLRKTPACLLLYNIHHSIRPPQLIPTGNYMFKVNNRHTRTTSEICSKLTIKTPNDTKGAVLVSLLLTLNIFHSLL